MSSVPKLLAMESKSHPKPKDIIIYKKDHNFRSRRHGEAQDFLSQRVFNKPGVVKCLDKIGRVHQETIDVN